MEKSPLLFFTESTSVNNLQCYWICINTAKLLQFKNLKHKYLSPIFFWIQWGLDVFLQQMFEISFYLDILLKTKFSYSYTCLPLSSIYNIHGYVYVKHLYIHVCVFLWWGLMEWNTTVMKIQLIYADPVGKSSLVTLTEYYLATVLRTLFKEVVIYTFLERIYLLDIFNRLTLPLIVHKFTANTISLLRILWSKMWNSSPPTVNTETCKLYYKAPLLRLCLWSTHQVSNVEKLVLPGDSQLKEPKKLAF